MIDDKTNQTQTTTENRDRDVTTTDESHPDSVSVADGTPASEPAINTQQSSETSFVDDATTLATQLDEMRIKNEQLQDQVLRLRAELDNTQRRHAKELENAHKFALDSFVKELLSVRDSLELGQRAAHEPETDLNKLREGTDLTLKLLCDVMTKFGVERIDPLHQPFNPDYHQAMSMQTRDDVAPNTVVTVMQCGYTLNGRLARPALVMVAQAPAAS
jgi:molecular chaperone GrpE